MKKFGFILVSIALLCVSCETEIKDIEIKHLQPIKIEIGDASATTLEVNVTADRDCYNHSDIDYHRSHVTLDPSFDSVYLAVSTSPDMTSPTIYRAKAIKKRDWHDDTTIRFVVSGLSPDVTYYLQAYVIPPYSKPIYSEMIHINKKFEIEAIDLGLSVKWANMNVGAIAPEDIGDHFAWGETSPKTDYFWSTYKYCKGSQYTMTKYCTNSSYGTVDKKTVLDLADDAAHVNWGDNWRMPTKAEQDELQDNCTWTWTTQNGIKGYLVKSKKNSNSIFLPATVNFNSYYWSSSLDESFSPRAYCLYCFSDDVKSTSLNRCGSQVVRAVCP